MSPAMLAVLLCAVFPFQFSAANSVKEIRFSTTRISAPLADPAGKRHQVLHDGSIEALQTAVHVHLGTSSELTLGIRVRGNIPAMPAPPAAVTISVLSLADTPELPMNAGISAEMMASPSLSHAVERQLMHCVLPPENETMGITVNCATNAVSRCGSILLAPRLWRWPFGRTLVLKVSVSTVALTSWKPIHDVLCTDDLVIELSSDRHHSPFVAAFDRPLVLFAPSEAFSGEEVDGLTSAHGGGIVMPPLLTSLGRRSSHPLGVFHTTFRPTSVVEQLPFFGSGLACVTDSVISARTLAQCTIPLRGATSFRLFLSTGEAVNSSRWADALSLVLQPRVAGARSHQVQCSLVDLILGSCKHYIECQASVLRNTTAYSDLRVVLQPQDASFPLIANTTASCTAAFAVVVTDFRFTEDDSHENSACHQEGAFPCSSNGEGCVAASSVCDGVEDCSNGADEAVCEGWVKLGHALAIGDSGCSPVRMSVSANLTTPALFTIMSRCMTHAARNPTQYGALLFTVQSNGAGQCELYPASCASPQSLVAHPDGTAPFSVLIARFGGSSAMCTSAARCSAHGEARPVSGGCMCVCHPGFFGAFCEVERGPSSIGGMAIHVPSLQVIHLPQLFFDLHFRHPGHLFWLEALSVQQRPASTAQLVMHIGATHPFALVSRGLAWVRAALSPNITHVSTSPPLLHLANGFQCGGNSCITLVSGLNASQLRPSSVAIVQVRRLSSQWPGVSIALEALDEAGNSLHDGAPCSDAAGTLLHYPDYSHEFVRSRNPPPASSLPPTTIFSCATSIPTTAVAVRVTFVGVSPPPRETIELRVMSHFRIPALVPPSEEVQTITGSRIIPFYGALASLGAALVLAALCGLFKYNDTQLVLSVLRAADPVISAATRTASKYPSVTCLAKWCYCTLVVCARHDGRPWYQQNTKLLHLAATAAFICFTMGGMFTLFYNYDLFDEQSNFDVVIELFADEDCEMSPTSPVAARIFRVPASGECERPVMVGATELQSPVPRFVRGACARQQNTYVAELAASDMSSTCKAARGQQFQMRSCQYIRVSDTLRGFAHISCLPADQASDYQAAHAIPNEALDVPQPLQPHVGALGRAAIRGESLDPKDAAPSTVNARTQAPLSAPFRPMENGPVYLHRWLRFDARADLWVSGWSSSRAAHRLLSHALDAGAVIGAASDLATHRVVHQTPNFRSMSPVLARSGTRHLPNIAEADLTLGVEMNGYSVESAVDDDGGAPSLEKPGASADEVMIFPDQLSSPFNLALSRDATIMFWVHAAPSTRGVAIALTDDWRLRDTGGVPLIRRLAELIEGNGGPSRTWFDAEWQVYYAVYLDGPSRTVRFITATEEPTGGDEASPTSLVQVVWQLDEIGASRLFTRSWHHISIVITRGQDDEANTVLRLFVDGESATSREGWDRCLSRPVAVMRSKEFAALPRTSAFNVVSPNGTVAVGALNAAIFGVEAFPYAVGEDEILSRGTLMMSNFFLFNKAHFTMIGFYVLFTAGALLLIMITGVIQDTWNGFVQQREEAAATAKRVYHRILRISDDGTNPGTLSCTRLTTGKQFSVPTVEVAIQMVGLSDDLFSTVLEEIQKLAISNDGAICDLLALLWTRGVRKYTPPAAFQQMYHEWKDKETGELSWEGNFVLPIELWNNFLTTFSGSGLLARRGAFRSPGVNDQQDEDSGIRQVRVTKIHVGGGKGGIGGRSGAGNATQSTGASSGTSGGGGASSFSAIVEMLLPVMTALQAAGLYVRNFRFPEVYLLRFINIFQYISLDFFNIPGLPPLTGPLLIFGVGCVIVLLLLYFSVNGHVEWLRYVAAYVQRRDAIDAPRVYAEAKRVDARRRRHRSALAGAAPAAVAISEINLANVEEEEDEDAPVVEEMPSVIEDWMVPLFRYVLPQKVTNAIDQYFDKSRRSNVVRVKKNDLLPAPVASRGVDWEILGTVKQVRVGVANDRSGQSVPLENVGFRCPLHGTILREVEQSNVCIKPFECFVIQSGERCTNKVGRVYSCQQRNPDGSKCVFALCHDHFKVTLIQYLIVTILSGVQMVRNLGGSGVLAFAVTALSVVVYFPVMRICLQFLHCDPEYGCIFEHCWNEPDRKFILGVCVVVLVGLYVGILLPVALYRELRARKKVLTRIFHRKEYHKIYLGLDETAEEEAARLERGDDGHELGRSAAWSERFLGWLLGVDSATHLAATVERADAFVNTRHPTVDFAEWERFLNDDESPMHHIYKFLELEWITLPPLMLLYRLGILVPTVFIQSNSVTQLMCVCGVEVCFGGFIFWSQPYVNSWVDTMYRAGSVHNITLLGLSAFHRVLVANGDTSGLSTTMLITTTVYLAFVVLLLLATTVWPLAAYGIKQLRVEWQLAKVGLRTNDLASLFLNPLVHDKATVDPDDVYPAMQRAAEEPKMGRHTDTGASPPSAEEHSVTGGTAPDLISVDSRKMSMLKRKSLRERREEKFQSFVKSRPNAIQLNSPNAK